MRNVGRYLRLLLAAGLLCSVMLCNASVLAADVVPPADALLAPQALDPPQEIPQPQLSFDYKMLKYADMPVTAAQKWQQALEQNRISSDGPPGIYEDHGPLAFHYSYTMLRKQEGNHSLSFSGASMQYNDLVPSGVTVPMTGGSMVLTYRYHGLLGGVIRPVVRLRTGVGSTWDVDAFRGRHNPLFRPWVMPEAGFEIVYKGVGLGFTTGWQFANQPDERELYYPWAVPRKKGFDWGTLLEGMIKNIYLVLE